jgi:hypothetical protein
MSSAARHVGAWLQFQRKIPDLVQENSTAVGKLEPASPILHGVGERSLHMAEEFALQESFRERRAIHPDEGSLPARGTQMKLLREKLLAYPAFTQDKDRGVRGSDSFYQIELFLDDGLADIREW